MEARVLVAGSRGALGTAIANELAASGFDVARGVRRVEREGEVRCDLDDTASVERAIGTANMVVNTVPHPALALEKAILRAGGRLLNVSSMTAAERRSLTEPGDSPQGWVVAHGGLAPGLSSLVARDFIERSPQADEIEIAVMFSARGTSGRAGGAFSHDALTAAPHYPVRRLALPPGMVMLRAFEVLPGERGWLGSWADGRSVRVCISFAERSVNLGLRVLNAAHCMRLLPRAPFVRSPHGSELTCEHVVEWVGVYAKGVLQGGCALDCHGDYRSTAIATTAQVRALLRRKDTPALGGVATLEEVIRLGDVRAEIEARGIRMIPAPAG